MARGEGQIRSDESSLHAFKIPTDEELLIACDTVRCIFSSHAEQISRKCGFNKDDRRPFLRSCRYSIWLAFALQKG